MLPTFDERNRNLIVNINGRLVPRVEAGVSPFDSVVPGGDAMWEGLRLYDGCSCPFDMAPNRQSMKPLFCTSNLLSGLTRTTISPPIPLVT